ncbi:MAG: V-type ATP synthase subunit D [Roseibium album]|uniref:V-type ATP synthase subunit D n=1 Tax=Roseibium album TaxID=311410 RepID=A0A0M7A2V1_9HYPH|nr:V-type ATP synthase subunit D [Roseibium album]MBG6154018.1 V/A-type H+-transporting ATPase subunit D [Labrenzia sp. EL_162]MBG6164665.1 V/A-type H+-transporting ATPase subunit D [Labrenzia sp. EL_195]MBG6174876.1 V/A-type H+-transporting ATPase subunit D [Labrenzia sp. EL_132]MBG6193853.1 V/A-type H+-transporting ATPase subunit D [Labrenzia sp. EL_159]MBG6204758.1 V/A-type H+-transporting ATPase subunit D [Labrenzia sp. EL_13]MBG6229488.1 V/A-type H+-transporting ATPase subunit D [Labrenz
MAKLALNKSSLARESTQLAEYRRFLPSLELKRLQITAERAKAKETLARLEQHYEQRFADLAAALPMLANKHVPLEGLVRLKGVERSEQNLSGTVLPVLGEIDVEVEPYSLLARPHWVDPYVDGMRELLRLNLKRDVARERIDKLIEAEAVISRRVNLFEKVLIPRAERNIKKIRMALADAERDAVVRAKISKRKTAARSAEERMARI